MTMSMPVTDAMASALASRRGLSITATVVCASKRSSSSRCGIGWYRLAVFGPDDRAVPARREAARVGDRLGLVGVSTCGTITPIAPMSSDRVRYW